MRAAPRTVTLSCLFQLGRSSVGIYRDEMHCIPCFFSDLKLDTEHVGTCDIYLRTRHIRNQILRIWIQVGYKYYYIKYSDSYTKNYPYRVLTLSKWTDIEKYPFRFSNLSV